MGMRVQSGSARGRRLKSLPKGWAVRPILARIRKSLFDILRPRMEGALFLDLFSGTGTVGIEALSNGARRAVLVDKNSQCCKMIQRNVDDAGFRDKAEVRRGDATENLFWLAQDKFDLAFMGPPYKDEDKKPLALTVPAMKRIEEAELLVPGGLLVGQHHEKEPLDGLSAAWEQSREKKYGDSVLTFFVFKGKKEDS